MATIYDDLTPEWLVATYLAGVDLTLDDGTPFDSRIFSESIRGAIAYVQHELSILLDTTKIKRERHDMTGKNREAWWQGSLDHRPVKKVTACRLHYGQTPAVDLPTEWVNLFSEIHGFVQLIPTTSTVGTYQFIGGMPSGLNSMGSSYLPGYFEYDYTAGFEVRTGTVNIPVGQTSATVTFTGDPFRVCDYGLTFTLTSPGTGDTGIRVSVSDRDESTFAITLSAAPVAVGGLNIAWKLSTIPDDLRAFVGMKACLLGLDVAGDLLGGAGIASSSISMDGLSQSVNTTSSPENSGYSARSKEFDKQLKVLIPALKAKYNTPNMFAF
jgi:hypothetical protein